MLVFFVILTSIASIFCSEIKPKDQSFVTVEFQGQLGNQLFQVAAAYSLALEHKAKLILPKRYLQMNQCEINENLRHVFWRIPVKSIAHQVQNTYIQANENNYAPIPFYKNLRIKGFFESENFFIRHKREVMDLFAPSDEILQYLQSKYGHIINVEKTIGIHVRTYYYDWLKSKEPYALDRIENPLAYLFSLLPAPDITFYEKALTFFPDDYECIVFSDYIPWAKEFLSGIPRKFTFIENEKQYHDLYLLSMCKHQIFSNSTFAWWGAYLNRNPKKKVIVRSPWSYDTKRTITDIIPKNWIVLESDKKVPIPNFDK